MSDQAALTLVKDEQRNAAAMMRIATDAAGACREIVMRTALELKGRKYVRVEGWMSIAAVYGCVPSIREVIEQDDGIRAIAELRKHDGTVLASAEGFVGNDEPTWASRAKYARRGMAQTRAVSRVCRSVFAFVVTLIDSGLQTTPAEEIPNDDEPPAVSAAPYVVAINGSVPVRDKSTTIKYGKNKGKFLCDVADLSYEHAAAKKSVEANDPKWHELNCKWLATVEAELARRNSDPNDAA